MQTEEKILIWLNSFEIYAQKQLQLLNCFENGHEFVAEFGKSFGKVAHLVDEALFNALCKSLKGNGLDEAVEQAMGYGAEIITVLGENYPERLKNIPNPPTVLYCIGDTKLLDTKAVAVVGSRKSSLYGEKVAKKFVKELVEHGVTIVSGMALGIDGEAHRAALENGGKTVAVLGGGFAKIYPPQHEQLFKKICKEGLVVTEFAPKTSSHPYHFPLRNRIVSGLSDGVFMVEAGSKSGTFTTVGHALEQGRDVFIAPGELYNFYCEGSNEMLKTIPDALVLSAKDIAERLKLVWKIDGREEIAAIQLSAEETLVADFLSAGARNFDEIALNTKLSPGALQSCLSKMEIRGILEKHGSNYKLQIRTE